MKLILSLCLTLMFIGCAGQTPEDLPEQENPVIDNPLPTLPPESVELGEGISSQAVLTCSKEGAEDIVYTAQTYQIPRPCQHTKAEGKSCVCEVVSTNEKFSGQNDIFLFATGSNANWCEEVAMDQIMNGQGVTLSYQDGDKTESKFVQAAHDVSYTCTRS